MPYTDKKKSTEAVAKHYAANKDEVLKKRIINRILEGKIPQMKSLEKFEITEEMINEMRAEVDLEPISIKAPRKKSPKKTKAKSPKKIDFNYIHDTINSLVEKNKITESSGDGYYRNFKRLMSESGCDDDCNLVEYLESEKIIKFINDKYSDSPNTRHTYLTAILAVIDNVDELNKFHEPYYKAWNDAKNEKEQFNIQRQLTEKVEKFSTIKDRIEKDFSNTSDEVLMINLYDEITVRNDFCDLTFNTEDPNHIDLEEGTITLKNFKKTSKKYDPIINYKLSDKLINLLKKSLEKKQRDKVFIKTMQSIFKKAKTGINQIRHSKISEELDGEHIKDKDKREKLREKMMHSSATQIQYIRSLK